MVMGEEGNVIGEVQIFQTGCEGPLYTITICLCRAPHYPVDKIAETKRAKTGIPGALLLAFQTAQKILHCGMDNSTGAFLITLLYEKDIFLRDAIVT